MVYDASRLPTKIQVPSSQALYRKLFQNKMVTQLECCRWSLRWPWLIY